MTKVNPEISISIPSDNSDESINSVKSTNRPFFEENKEEQSNQLLQNQATED